MDARAGEFAASLRAWRARPGDEQVSWFVAQTPEERRRVVALIAACPDRGGVLPLSMQPDGCSKCGELSECRKGLGQIPGRVATRDCYACRSGGQIGVAPCNDESSG